MKLLKHFFKYTYSLIKQWLILILILPNAYDLISAYLPKPLNSYHLPLKYNLIILGVWFYFAGFNLWQKKVDEIDKMSEKLNDDPNLKASIESAHIEQLTGNGWRNDAVFIKLKLWNEGNGKAYISNVKLQGDSGAGQVKKLIPLDSKIDLPQIFKQKYNDHDKIPRIEPIIKIDQAEVKRIESRFLYPEGVSFDAEKVAIYRHNKNILKLKLKKPLKIKQKRFVPEKTHLLDS